VWGSRGLLASHKARAEAGLLAFPYPGPAPPPRSGAGSQGLPQPLAPKREKEIIACQRGMSNRPQIGRHIIGLFGWLICR